VKERGLVMRDHEVRCVLAGEKTQLRRPVQLRVPWGLIGGRGEEHDLSCWGYAVEDQWMVLARGLNSRGMPHGHTSIPCPMGEAGDRIWVKEAFNWSARGELAPGEHWKLCPERTGWRAPFCVYRADGIKAHPEHPDWGATIWKSSTQMPRWASRITLEVTGVRVQRLQDISEEDAKAEGVQLHEGAPMCPCQGEEEDPGPTHLDTCAWRDEDYDPEGSPYHDEFAILWNSINSKRAPWSSNPFVWVVEFKVANVAGSKEAA
jgi:hypothetical protein